MAQFRLASMLVLLVWGLTHTSEAIAADSRLQILNFAMERCEPCRAMQPTLAKLIMEGWPIRHIDVAKEPQLAAQYQLKSAPTLIILSDGRELDRVVGTIAYNKLLARLEAARRAAQSATPSGASTELTPLPALAGRGPSAGASAFEPSMVRGQSPGPTDVPDLDVASERMLEFVKDLPEPPKLIAPTSPSQPNNIQLASSSATIGRAAIQPASQSAAPASRPQVDAIARAQLATVRIRIEDANSIAFGTGTVIYVHNGQALVLTCGHMFRDLGKDAQMSIDVFDNAGRITNVPAQVVSHSTDKGDIGLMEFRCPYPITPVPIARRAPAIGEPAFSFGCDRGADPTRRDTQIKRLNRYLGPANVEIYGAPVVGRSGGALFNAQGQIIGVCNAADAEDDEGIYAALPVIDEHVAALRLESLPSDEATVENPVQLASATSNLAATNNLGRSIAPAVLPTSTAATQVRCVIRDAQGKETALLIDRPTDELVAMLRQSAGK